MSISNSVTSVNEESKEVNQQPASESVGCCSIFSALLQLCGVCCYVGCPPVPELITRKIAFHPPKRGAMYKLRYVQHPEKIVHDAAEVADAEFVVEPMPMGAATELDYMKTMEQVEPFIVRTAYRNHLVCVRCTPKTPTKIENLKDKVIIFSQPNSSDIGGFLQPLFINFPQLAEIFETDVYGFDYSGYGYSTGRPCEKNVYADIRAVYEYVRRTRPDKKIVLLGYSIGTTAAVDLAASRPAGIVGMILIAPFTSGMRLMGKHPDRTESCCLDRFANIDKVSRVDVPVLICHGTEDAVVPPEHGKVLYGKLPKPVAPIIVYGADHQSILNGQHPQTFSRIYKFLRDETNGQEKQEKSASSRKSRSVSPTRTPSESIN